MANEKEKNIEVTEGSMNKTKKRKETTYSLQEFIDNAEALGYKSYVVAGALDDVKGEITKAEFFERIEEFLHRRVE